MGWGRRRGRALPGALLVLVPALVLVLALAPVLAPRGAPAAGPPPPAAGLEVEPGESSLDLTPALEWLEDPSRSLSAADLSRPEIAARFRPWSRPGTPHLGLSRSAFWLRFNLSRAPAAPAEWLLVVGQAKLAELDVYPPGQAPIRTGAARPLASRPWLDRHFALPLRLSRQPQTYLLRVASPGPLALPLTLWHPQAFLRHQLTIGMLQALYCGGVLALVLYNLFLAASLRDRRFLLYALVATSTGLAVLAVQGLGRLLLWPDAPQFDAVAVGLFVNLSGGFCHWFARDFLNLRAYARRLDRLMRALSATLFLLALAFGAAGPGWLPIAPLVQASLILALATGLVLIGAGLLAWRRRQPGARFYLLAWGLLASTVLVGGLHACGLIVSNAVTANAVQIGSAAELLLFSLALADSVRQERQSRLEAERRHVLELDATRRQLEQTVAQRTGELEAMNRRLQQLVREDGLTGVANRRHCDAQLEQLWRRLQRRGGSLAVVLCDVDFFKAYNDHYGHLAGDACLVAVARALAGVIRRPEDCLARFGGEEFIYLLADVDLDGARVVAEAARTAVARLALPHAASPQAPVVTVSAGVSAAVPGRAGTAADLIQAADAALYRAKHLGRNRVELQPSGGP